MEMEDDFNPTSYDLNEMHQMHRHLVNEGFGTTTMPVDLELEVAVQQQKEWDASSDEGLDDDEDDDWFVHTQKHDHEHINVEEKEEEEKEVEIKWVLHDRYPTRKKAMEAKKKLPCTYSWKHESKSKGRKQTVFICKNHDKCRSQVQIVTAGDGFELSINDAPHAMEEIHSAGIDNRFKEDVKKFFENVGERQINHPCICFQCIWVYHSRYQCERYPRYRRSFEE